MMRMRQKLLSGILALTLIFSGYAAGVFETQSVYADSKIKVENNIISGQYVKGLGIGTNRVANCSEISYNAKTDMYEIAIADAAAQPCFFVNVNTQYAFQFDQYKLTGGTGKSQPYKDSKDQIAPLVSNAKLPVGEQVETTFTVGKKNSAGDAFAEGETETIKMLLYKKLCLSKLSAADENKQTVTMYPAKLDPLQCTYAFMTGANTQTVTLNYTTKTNLAIQAENEETYTKDGIIAKFIVPDGALIKDTGGTATFDLSKLNRNEDGQKYATLQLTYSDATKKVGTNTYTILFDDTDYTPTVSLKTDAELCVDKDTSLTLGVNAETQKGMLSYQWERLATPDSASPYTLTGETQENYNPQTQNATTTYYRCKVTNTVNDAKYIAYSNVITVRVNATYASKPIIKKQPQSVVALVGTEQYLLVEAKRQDTGAILSYQWYEKAKNSEDVDIKIEDATGYYYSLPTSESGVRQYYCVVTATINGHSASINTDTVTVTLTAVPGTEVFSGAGTKESPYKIKDLNDLKTMQSIMEKGYGMEGKYFELQANLELPSNWDGLGTLIDKNWHSPNEYDKTQENGGKNVTPFMGIFDGKGHRITIPDGGKAPFKYVRKATIKNLKLYGANVDGSALISSMFLDYGPTGNYDDLDLNKGFWTVIIDNVTLESNSKTSDAGFMQGTGSGADKVTIRNSTVEQNVKVNGASFVREFNGEMINCSSYADVRGGGGLAEYKGQSMGECRFLNCSFFGTVKSGSYAGGIIGSGYGRFGEAEPSAPNTPIVTVQNCVVAADVEGKTYVGGIIGTEPSIVQCWSNGSGGISNNVFYGVLKGTESNAVIGGIAGYMNSLNNQSLFENNFYLDSCGAKSGIGKVKYIDTSAMHENTSGTIYFSTEKGTSGCPSVNACNWERGANRNDDPLGADKEKLAKRVSATEMADGAVTKALNASKSSYKNWSQSVKYPIHGNETILYAIELSGKYQTEYKTGDTFVPPIGMTVIGKLSAGSTNKINLSDKELKFTGFNSNQRGVQTITVSYGVAKTTYEIVVLYNESQVKKEVVAYFTLLGDSNHSEPTNEGGPHTLSSNNLKTWVERTKVVIDNNTSVFDVFKKVLGENKIDWKGSADNKYSTMYISAVQIPGTSSMLGEFSNGPNSGWMYTLNGKHPSLGVAQQFLNGGEEIVFHYTDDWTKESDTQGWVTGEDKPQNVTTSGAAGSATTTAPTEVKVSGTTAAATVKAENQSEILKQAVDKKSAEIILEVSKADSKGADSVQLSLEVSFVKNISDKTNADLTVNTENGKVTLDQETIKTVLAEAKGATITLEVTKVTKPTEAQKKAAGANGHLLKLTIKSGDKVISDFNKGKVKVVAEIVSKLLDKKVAAIHIADDGKIEQLAGKVLTIGGKKFYEFTTPHFSTFALVDADELGLEVKEEPAVDVKTLTAKLTPIVRSAKTAKKNVKVTTSLDKQDKAIVQELKDAGYTVKYRFYRSTKKAAGYKAAVTKKTASYTNTSGKKGTKYFYKVQVRVYDENGKLTAKTALKQCKYASRTWTKGK